MSGSKSSQYAVVGFAGLLLALSAIPAHGQNPPPAMQPITDPLMSLMMSQPRIDVTSPVQASAVLDPPVVRTNEWAFYRLSLNALEESGITPDSIPDPDGLEIKAGARGQMMQMGAGVLVPITAYNFRVRAIKPGLYIIPEFTVQVYGGPVRVPPVRLQVLETLPVGVAQSRSVALEVAATNLFVGQPVNVRVLLPGAASGMVLPLTQVQFPGSGFVADMGMGSQRIIPLPRVGGEAPTVPAYVFETMITPIESGRLKLFAQGFTAGFQASGPVTVSGPMILPGGVPSSALLETDAAELNVRALPREGELPGFTGAIGRFGVDPPQLTSPVVRVGEPAKLSVTVRAASGNLGRLVPPPPPRDGDWQILTAAGDNTPPQLIQARGFALFEYTLVPRVAGKVWTPAIPFSCFDPVAERYVDLTIPPVAVTVERGALPADPAIVQSGGQATTEPREPVLTGLAAAPGRGVGTLLPAQGSVWFWTGQCLPAAFFAGLWGWDRRRRYLECHPDVVRRARARRAMRREWRACRHAARRQDASAFARAAVGALRAGCAPHYPAEPRALVGVDILQVLGESERAGEGGRLVQRVFAVTDAADFAAASVSLNELLGLEPELANVIAHLESKL